jgi:hypothetical protein
MPKRYSIRSKQSYRKAALKAWRTKRKKKKEVGARDFNYSKRSLFSMADRQG